MRILLHICCGACAIGPYRDLTAEGHEVVGLFYNTNIHPLIEFRRRLKSVKQLQEHLPVPIVFVEDYGLREWLEGVDWRGRERCADCYRLRLRHAAVEARERGIGAISTTLLTSAHQHHEMIRGIGAECAEAEGVEFVHRDWRPLAESNHEEAARLRLYLQQYCGCVFSECERFKDTGKHLYRGPGPLKALPE